ncbi:MAG: D-glycero-D-manno-heptose 1,7-bisphosphate phosphatase [Halanaerobiales bacterium]|nr:D-glycero-D-manno-heptose 1,7-bisphosphate phosphatase [Halanaerobiales bacterium]
MNRAVFLDRDGTINVDKGYLYKKKEFEFIPGAIEAIKMLNDNDYLVIVITNQSGVARGYYSEPDVINLHNFINRELNKYHAYVDKFYYCPHHQEGIGRYKRKCKCRKPDIGMIEQAVKEFNIDKSQSYMIGNEDSDIKAGINAGLKRSFKVTSSLNLLQIVKGIIHER